MVLLAIDGPAGAGKTTLATKLAAQFSLSATVQVIHMDELYSGWEDALSDDLTQILNGILLAHEEKREFSIKIFNWNSMNFGPAQIVTPTDVLILEGVGAAQGIVRAAGATTYWLDVAPEVGLQRVLDRDGAHLAVQMRQWQIDQEIHFRNDQTRENCQYKISS